MAASEVIVLDTRSCVPHQPGTQRLERILEHWYKDLKANVVSEFLQFKSSVENEQQQTINELQSKASPEVMKLRREIDNLRELLHTLERSVSQKDKLVSNLVKSLEKERDKYEKLRAVSSDKLDHSSDESDVRSVEAVKNYNKILLKRCWYSWCKKVKTKQSDKNVANNVENTTIVTVKTENDHMDNETMFSDDSLLISDGDENLLERPDGQYSLFTSGQGDSEERSYPAYVSTASSYQRSSSMAAKIPGMRPYPVAAATSEEESDSEKPTDDRSVTVISSEVTSTSQPTTPSVSVSASSSLPSTTRSRVRKRTFAKTTYERGKKMYQMKDRIRIKRVQSLRTGAGSFLSTDDRPTMATNAFQTQDDDQVSGAHVVTESDPFNNQSIIVNPEHALDEGSDTSTAIVHVQPQFGSNQSDWETAKNNISQYMNQMIIQGEAASKEQQRKTDDDRTILGTSPGIDSPTKVDNKNSSVVLSNEPSTSSGQDSKQNVSEGQLCTECNETIPARAMKKHKRNCKRRIPTTNEKWTCKDCGKSFVSGKRYLEDHIMSVHWGTSPYECEVCGKGFASYNNYKRHLLVHSGDRPFECNICKKSFNQYCNLARHLMRIHSISKEEALFLNFK